MPPARSVIDALGHDFANGYRVGRTVGDVGHFAGPTSTGNKPGNIGTYPMVSMTTCPGLPVIPLGDRKLLELIAGTVA